MGANLEFDLLEHLEVIDRAAKRVAGRHPGAFDWEDVKQEICEHMLRYPEIYQKALETGVLFQACMKTGNRYCQQEQLTQEYFSSSWNYSSEEIKKLMAEYFRHVEVQSFSDYLRYEKESIEVVLKFVDFEMAYSKCRTADQKIFAKKHLFGEQLSASERTAYSRGVRRLTAYINHEVNKLVFEKGKSFHEGPQTGNLPSPNTIRYLKTIDRTPYEGDAVDEYQRMMEATY